MNKKSAYLLVLATCVGLSACGMPPESYRKGEPYQSIEVTGEPKAIAECTQQALVGAGWIGMQLGHDPKTDLYTLTSGDPYSGVLYAIAFDPAGHGKTAVSTRGIMYMFAKIPPWSQQAIDSAKSCEEK